MSVGKNSSMDVNTEMVGVQAASGLEWFSQRNELVRSRRWMDSFRERWGRFLGLQRNDTDQTIRHLHDEAAFHFLIANEVKRSERSGRRCYILLVYLSGSDERGTPVKSQMLTPLLPILSAVLRDTDYIGWYRDGHVLGGVLTAWGEYSTEQSLSQVEQRFWRMMKHKFPTNDFTRLSVRLFELQELSRVKSGRPSDGCDDGGQGK